MLTIFATQTNFGNKTFQSCTNFETPKKCQKWTPKWCQNLTPKMGLKKWHPKRGANFCTKTKSNQNSNLNLLFGRHFLDPILAIKCQILAPFWGPFLGSIFGLPFWCLSISQNSKALLPKFVCTAKIVNVQQKRTPAVMAYLVASLSIILHQHLGQAFEDNATF